MEIPSEETLRQMPYTALKKLAKERGIKASMKTEALIAKILLNADAQEDSFVTMEQKIINSSRKRKIELLNKNKDTPTDSPRRDTYTLATPTVSTIPLNSDLVISSASPALKKTPVPKVLDESLNVTLTRGSEKKSFKKRKVSFVTPVRRSSRISAATPQYNSIKERPKTPIPSRGSSGRKNVSASVKGKKTPEILQDLIAESENAVAGKMAKRPSTPMPTLKLKSRNSSSAKPSPKSAAKNSGIKKDTKIPAVLRSKAKRNTSPSPQLPKNKPTPDFKKLHQKEFSKMESIAEYQKRKTVNSAKKLMEQLQYHNPAKSSISKKVAVKKNLQHKVFSGIPFIPSVTSTKNMKLNFAASNLKPVSTTNAKKPAAIANAKKPAAIANPKKPAAIANAKKPVAEEPQVVSNLSKLPLNGRTKTAKFVSRENTPLTKKLKFDLQASLSKKLSYKPHKGPLKPLAEKNLNNTAAATPITETKNQVVKAKRAEAREVVRGVRMNRRFELQMKNRKAIS